MDDLVIGIDAGGTRVRAALARAAGGAVLRTAEAGAGNARSVAEDVLTDRLAACLGGLWEAVPGVAAVSAPRERVVAVVAGVAGAEPRDPDDPGTRRVHAALRAALVRCGVGGDGGAPAVSVRGDTEVAFAAGPGAPADGVVVIAGTGAAAARIRGRRQTVSVDGLGWLLGDEGSGFWIGREGLRAALRALDGRGPGTVLTELLPEAVAPEDGWRDVRDVRMGLVDAGLSGVPGRVAGLCPVVVRAAEAGDAVAGGILDEAAYRLAESVTALRPARGEALVTTGGLLGPEGPLLGRFAERAAGLGLSPSPVRDGVAGALALARAAL